ncbi:MAG: tRNA pseudouridine(38-40) synthase TruA [Saccharospirillaceae bacterium]|nr:tRNA pseudouridine(38-40) synthase TruA [Pseudomonadales bacterium]NRB80214.1 tRNA pseudouridine(38-40) synthase TruA [Saccharospirillaceae bacterium]
MTEIFKLESEIFTTRIALAIEFDGSSFNGWQTQTSGVPTVQQTLQAALSQIANHNVKVICAGRTDTGVHATAMVVHFDTNANRKLYGWVVGSNKLLPKTVSVKWAKEVPLTFHARYSALQRRYRYLLYSSPFRQGILKHGVSWERRELDAELMNTAAKKLLGTHDFTSVRSSGCQAHSPVKTITNISVKQYGQLVVLDLQANSFLYHMVRNIMGLLIPIGAKERPVDWIDQVISEKDRRKGGVNALSHGLYFVGAIYDEKFDLPKLPPGPFFLGE